MHEDGFPCEPFPYTGCASRTLFVEMVACVRVNAHFQQMKKNSRVFLTLWCRIICYIQVQWLHTPTRENRANMQHWCEWLVAAITWANVDPDLCRHMASLGHNPAYTLDNNYYVKTTPLWCKWRRFDVIVTLLLRHMFDGHGLSWTVSPECLSELKCNLTVLQ